MKRNFLKRIGAVALAVAVSLTMGVTSFAATNLDGGTAGAADDPAGPSVTLEKAIQVTNHTGTSAFAPDVTFTYTLSNGTAGGTVTDGTTTATYKAGDVAYLASGSAAAQTVTFAKTESATSGESISKDITWTFNPAAFPSAGVYRYVVAETATNPADIAGIGIERPSGYDASKYLDVYVQNTDSGLQIYGYALVDDDSTVSSSSAKSEGWKSGDDLDVYETYNITITNTIDGAGADLTAEFPFAVALTGNIANANVTVDGTGSSIGISGGSVTGTLGNGETLIIQGLPKSALFSVTETNPTTDTYELTSTATGITGATTVTGVDIAGSATGNVLTGGDVSKATDAVAVNVTNHLGTISPTNVIMRFAPFLFIFGAAILLLVVMRRRKTQDAE